MDTLKIGEKLQRNIWNCKKEIPTTLRWKWRYMLQGGPIEKFYGDMTMIIKALGKMIIYSRENIL